GFVVEADVAARDWHVERAAGLGDPFDRLDELPHDLGTLGVAEVQAVGRADRHAAGAGDVSRRLRDGEHRAPAGIQVDVAAVAVGRDRERAVRPFDAYDAGAHTGGREGVG